MTAEVGAGMSQNSKLPEQAGEGLDLLIHPAAPQRIPYDRLMRTHHVDTELAFQHVECAGSRPMWRRQQDGVGLRMFLHQLAAEFDCGVLWNPANLVERTAPAGRAQHLAAE